MKKFLQEIENYYRSLPPLIPPEVSFRYMGGGRSQWRFLGLKVPQIRSLFLLKKDQPKVLLLSPTEAIEVWSFIWHQSSTFETLCAPLFFITQKKNLSFALQWWNTVSQWAERIDNWAHSDILSSYYSFCVESGDKRVLVQLKKWNKSPNPWLQRQSIVSLLYYSRQRKKFLPFKEMIPLIENLLSSKDSYVQKGVGWTLRELGNVYPELTWEFLEERVQDLPAISFSYATEKLTVKKKSIIKKIRIEKKLKKKN